MTDADRMNYERLNPDGIAKTVGRGSFAAYLRNITPCLSCCQPELDTYPNGTHPDVGSQTSSQLLLGNRASSENDLLGKGSMVDLISEHPNYSGSNGQDLNHSAEGLEQKIEQKRGEIATQEERIEALMSLPMGDQDLNRLTSQRDKIFSIYTQAEKEIEEGRNVEGLSMLEKYEKECRSLEWSCRIENVKKLYSVIKKISSDNDFVQFGNQADTLVQDVLKAIREHQFQGTFAEKFQTFESFENRFKEITDNVCNDYSDHIQNKLDEFNRFVNRNPDRIYSLQDQGTIRARLNEVMRRGQRAMSCYEDGEHAYALETLQSCKDELIKIKREHNLEVASEDDDEY